MKRVLLLIIGLFLVLGIVTSAASAMRSDPGSAPALRQGCPTRTCPTATPPPPPPDTDGDGLVDRKDSCPTVPGPASNLGCPLPDNSNSNPPQTHDRDGDGVPDVNDRCPDAGGPASNSGCPVDQTAPQPSAVPTIALPPLPTSGDCVLATRNAERVNVRANASLKAEIVAHLDPQTLYPVLATRHNAEGDWDEIAAGWVAAWVTRQGGSCSTLPAVQFIDVEQQPGPPDDLLLMDSIDFSLSDPPEPDDCASGWSANWISHSNGQSIHIGFCDGSVRPTACDGSVHPTSCDGSVHPTACDGSVIPTPTQWCVEQSADGKTFLIGGSLVAPPEPEKPGLSIQWYAGIGSDNSDFPGETLIIAVLQSPDGLPLMLIWHSPHGAQGININWSFSDPPEPDKPGFMIHWSPQNQLDPVAPANSNPRFFHGIVIRVAQGSTEASEGGAQGITIEWLPSGAVAGANELTLDDTAGGANAPFKGRGLDIATIDGQPVSSGQIVIGFAVQ